MDQSPDIVTLCSIKIQERAYNGIQSRSAWRFDREMRRRLILRETGFTR